MSQAVCEPARVGRHRHALDPAGDFLELLKPVPMRLSVHALADPQGYRIDRCGQRFDRPLRPSLFDLSGLLRLRQMTGRGQSDIPHADEDHAGRGPGVGALRPPLQRLLPPDVAPFAERFIGGGRYAFPRVGRFETGKIKAVRRALRRYFL